MTVATTTNRIADLGDGVTQTFSFPYYFASTANLVVLLQDNTTMSQTLQTLGTDYTVTGTSSNGVYPNGGTINMTVAPPTGKTLVAYRDPNPVQNTHLVTNDPLPAPSVENVFDLLTIISQRLKERIDRSVRLSDGYVPAFNPTLPLTLTPNCPIVIGGDGASLSLGISIDPAAAVYAGAGFIGETAFTLANNQVSAADITGCLVNPALYRSVEVDFTIYRNTTGAGATELAERSKYLAVYSTVAASWELTQLGQVGDAGVTVTITSGGQFQYTSSGIGGTAATSKLSFRVSTMGV